MKEYLTVYVTKYALTTGIEAKTVYLSDQYAYSKEDRAYFTTQYRPDEWHKTKEEAIAQADKLRLKKIANLKKQIAKLENLTFE